jgi:hypothetical protein
MLPAGSPYRVPETTEPLAWPELRTRKRPRPWIGPALSVFAVLLWAFVVAGQFTTSWMTGAPISQGFALFLVMLATFAAWISGIRRSRFAMPPRRPFAGLVGRGIGIAAIAGLLFFVSIFAATAIGNLSSNDHDLFIAFVLVGIATLAAVLGPRLTSEMRPETPHRMRFIVVVMWLAGALLTLVAGVDLAANG